LIHSVAPPSEGIRERDTRQPNGAAGSPRGAPQQDNWHDVGVESPPAGNFADERCRACCATRGWTRCALTLSFR
jgi:hypothetical protein